MSERISDTELKQLQSYIFTCQSRTQQFMSLVPDQGTANANLMNYLKELATKYNCDFKEIMSDGEIKRGIENAVN